ncbi:hypothetical protein MCW_01158 [Cardidatus Bartonella washoeensis 085-0475]|uniref:Uncharacterized protein n=1 Tax=Cardidatus Bartonella washoeensis 085-0475 TaxID=1094564 RepID=J0Z9K6_9HYPH|nr:hypothetical protein MCW_01158 [Bartonella washoeensis 085-0475]
MLLSIVRSLLAFKRKGYLPLISLFTQNYKRIVIIVMVKTVLIFCGHNFITFKHEGFVFGIDGCTKLLLLIIH